MPKAVSRNYEFCSKFTFRNNFYLYHKIIRSEVRNKREAAERCWEKSPFGTIFPNDRSATPTIGKPSLLSHDVLPTVGFDAFPIGVKNSFRNDDKAERILVVIL